LSRSTGGVVPVARPADASWVHRSGQASQTGDTLWIYQDSLETRSSPGNEGGFTHQDASFQPAAWHIDTIYGCQGHAFWCGRVDSSWVLDSNRYGYDNNWTQVLGNFVSLTGAVSPVKLGFRQQLSVESGFDFASVEIFDPDQSWVQVGQWTGVIHGSGVPCDTFTVVIPDSIRAKYDPVRFRFVFTSDIEGSSSDGLVPNADGWAIDNVSVKAGLNDLRFFDDFEFGPGTWTVSTFPAVGDFWRIQANAPGEQVCTTNTSKVWNVTNPATNSLTTRMDDKLISPPIFENHADQVFVAFDVYRNLPTNACFYYNVQFRTRNAGSPWSLWTPASGQVYSGNEKEWMRQTVSLTGAAGKDSVEFMLDAKDYSEVFCGGVSTPAGTSLYFDNLALGVIGLAPPSIAASEEDLFQDTYKTAPFFSNDNFNTPRGDSVSVRLSASRGLKQASFFYSLNGGSFTSLPLVPFGIAIPSAYSADVPAGTYARGTELRYYFSVTDSLDAVATLPSDALASSHYFTATILPAIQSPSGTCGGNTANVLYVNASEGVDGGASMTQSLAALGLRFDRYDVNAPADAIGNGPGGSPPGDPVRIWPGVSASTLGVYSAIVWDVGDRSSSTLAAEDQQLLQSWNKLPGGNRGLLLAGDNLAYDLATNGQDIGTFLTCALGASFLRDVWEDAPQDSLQPVTKGAAGTRIASESFPLDGTCPLLNRFDALQVSPCGGAKARPWITYPNALIASVEERDSVGVVADSSRSVLLGFSLETVPSVSRLNYLLYRTLVNEFEVPGCYVATGVDESASSGSPRARLYNAAPNPFNPWTSIRFSLAHPARVRLLIFDVSGAMVRSLADRAMPAGEYHVTWDGTNDRGRPLASGAYFYRLEADRQVEAKKLILLR
jgi:flagellar hook capping protein FlgD